MKQSLNKVLTVEAKAENEWIAGVQRKFLFDGKYWTDFKKANEEEIFDLINKHLEFKPRNDEIELDETFKQIIPYFLIRKDGKYFISARKSKGGDSRAHGFKLIGFGGHLRAEDIKGREMKDWLKREFKEEIKAGKISEITFLGVANDDSDAVNGIGKVHFGLVFVVDVEGDVSINEEDKFEIGEFMTIKELKSVQDEMESWSKLIAEKL